MKRYTAWDMVRAYACGVLFATGIALAVAVLR